MKTHNKTSSDILTVLFYSDTVQGVLKTLGKTSMLKSVAARVRVNAVEIHTKPDSSASIYYNEPS